MEHNLVDSRTVRRKALLTHSLDVTLADLCDIQEAMLALQGLFKLFEFLV